MKKITLVALLLVTTIGFSQNIAYIYRDSILVAVPNYVENIKKLDSIQKSYTSEIKQGQEQLNTKLNKLLTPYNIKENESLDIIRKRMTSIDTTSLGLLLQEDKMIQNKAKSYDNMINFTFQRDVQPLLDKVNKAIEKYATANKIDVVYTMEQIQPAFAFINRKRNITKIIIEAVKK